MIGGMSSAVALLALALVALAPLPVGGRRARAQAAPHLGSGLARKKHQIGTLFANAKLRELDPG